MARFSIIAAILMLACVSAPAGAAAASMSPGSRCAECHFANFFDVPGSSHLGDWQRSAHGRHEVGCERCHGGDATTFDPVTAHRGILDSRNPASAVNRRNLPVTCGGCHSGALSAFRRSHHAALVEDGDARAPSCSTCHGTMNTRVPSLAAFEAQCARCHPADATRPDYAQTARAGLDELESVRLVLNHTETLISRVADESRRRRLTAAHGLAATTLQGAVDAVHAFDMRVMRERLDAAHRAADELAADVVNR